MTHLRPASVDDMLALRQHFSSLTEVQLWGGEGFTAPLTRSRFMQQLQLKDTESFVLSDHDVDVAYGQLCDRFAKHHLARLLVFPAMRNRGYGKSLVFRLLQQGLQQNARLDFSLFVYKSNTVAVKLYQGLGFVETAQPQPHRDDLMFMQLTADKAKRLLHSINC